MTNDAIVDINHCNHQFCNPGGVWEHGQHIQF